MSKKVSQVYTIAVARPAEVQSAGGGVEKVLPPSASRGLTRVKRIERAWANGAAMIFKIVEREEWRAAQAAGVYRGSSDDLRDGYIHFSAADQVQATAAKYFAGKADLLLVAFDPEGLGAQLRWEPARGGQLFPHLHAPLPTALARWEQPLALADDGVPIVPEGLLA